MSSGYSFQAHLSLTKYGLQSIMYFRGEKEGKTELWIGERNDREGDAKLDGFGGSFVQTDASSAASFH